MPLEERTKKFLIGLPVFLAICACLSLVGLSFYHEQVFGNGNGGHFKIAEQIVESASKLELAPNSPTSSSVVATTHEHITDIKGRYDNCTKLNCQNGGECRFEQDGYRRFCTGEHEGDSCQIKVDTCTKQLGGHCLNGGTCQKKSHLYPDVECKCPPGYEGKFCEKSVSPCSTNPCKYGGLCTEGPDKAEFSCQCKEGFHGTFCSEDVDECSSGNACFNGGVCTNTLGGYNCKCLDGFRGHKCGKEMKQSKCSLLIFTKS